MCSVEGCNRLYRSKGYCEPHYQHNWKYGYPVASILELHSKRKTPEYTAWVNMRARCYRKTQAGYKHYGGRSITVCERWRTSFIAFYEDMGARPSVAYSLDRIDNDGNYEPGNCRWATAYEQSNNQRSNRLITYRGRTQTITLWSSETGIDRTTLSSRIDHLKWPIKKALTTPPRTKSYT